MNKLSVEINRQSDGKRVAHVIITNTDKPRTKRCAVVLVDSEITALSEALTPLGERSTYEVEY